MFSFIKIIFQFSFSFSSHFWGTRLIYGLQLEILQRQVSTLADSQSNAEDRTTRTKTEHAVLQARYHMLEDQLREVCNFVQFVYSYY